MAVLHCYVPSRNSGLIHSVTAAENISLTPFHPQNTAGEEPNGAMFTDILGP